YYDELISEIPVKNKILTFSTEVLVLDIIDSLNENPNARIAGLFCKDRSAKEVSKAKDAGELSYEIDINGDINSYSAKVEVRYQITAIWVTLFAKVKNLRYSFPAWFNWDNGYANI